MSRSGKRPAQSSAAGQATGGRINSDALESFLGGHAAALPPTHHTNPMGESANNGSPSDAAVQIPMHLKLLTKTSEITKQKSFERLIPLLKDVEEGTLESYAATILETVMQHVQHVKVEIRTQAYQLLEAFLQRGKRMKVHLLPVLHILSGQWVMGMHDMERLVCQAARRAFDAGFTTEKQPLMLSQYMDGIMGTILECVNSTVDARKPLKDDTIDPRANPLYSALKSLGFMAQQVSLAQQQVLSSIVDPSFMSTIIPADPPLKEFLLANTPLVRSAVLSLLRDVVRVCPLNTRLHKVIAMAVKASIKDYDVAVASRTWELLLFWAKDSLADAISAFEPHFLDEVVNCVVGCDRANVAEVMYPCLYPFVAQLTKDKRCDGVLDEFCGALVEKMGLIVDTPNVSAAELSVVVTALMEMWQLQCARLRGTDHAGDCEELFTVAMTNFCLLTEAVAKWDRYVNVLSGAAVSSMVKVSAIDASIFSQCVITLAGKKEAAYLILPDDASEGVIAAYHKMQAKILGELTNKVERDAAATAAVRNGAEFILAECCERGDIRAMAIFLRSTSFRPESAVGSKVVKLLCEEVRAGTCAHRAGEDREAESQDLQCLISAALKWEGTPGLDELIKVTAEAGADSVKSAIMDHLMQDPAMLLDMLQRLLREYDFDGVRQCLDKYASQGAPALPSGHQDVLTAAVVESLQGTLKLLVAEDSDEEEVDTESEEGSSTDESGSSHSDCTASGSDDSKSDAASSSADSDSSSSTKRKGRNENQAEEVLYRVVQWCDLLGGGELLCGLLGLSTEKVEAKLLDALLELTVSVAPPLHPERYAAFSTLQAGMKAHMACADEDMEGEGEELILFATEAKIHYLNTDHYDLLVSSMRKFLLSAGVAQETLDTKAELLFQRWVKMDDELPLPFFAVQQLSQLLPFASDSLLQKLCGAPETWSALLPRAAAVAEMEKDASLALFDGYFTAEQVEVSLTKVVCVAQLHRLYEGCNAAAELLKEEGARREDLAHLFCVFVQMASIKEAVSGSVQHSLFQKTLPTLFAAMKSAEIAGAVSAFVSTSCNEYLMPTIASLIRDMALPGDRPFLVCTLRLVTKITSTAIDKLFTSEGARGIAASSALLYDTFYRVLDEAADALKCNIGAQVPQEQERLLNEASCMLPSWDSTTAKTALVVLRHLSSLPAVSTSTVKSLITYAATLTPIEALELLAQLSCTRVPDAAVYSDLIRAIIDYLCRCHRLIHLPTNGRLQKEAGTSLLASTPVPMRTLRRVVMAAVLSRRGVVLHSRNDSVLRSTVNLVVFDAVCECVMRLRKAKESEVVTIAKLISFTSAFMGGLLTSDVTTLRASEESVRVLAQALRYTYLWLLSMKLPVMEGIGLHTVAGVVRSVCLLANLTLMRSKVALREILVEVMKRPSLKALRTEYLSTEPAKLNEFRSQNGLLARSGKQRIILFPYLLCWCIYASNEVNAAPQQAENEESAEPLFSPKDWRNDVSRLLDLALTLMLTPVDGSSKRVEDTFLGSCLSEAGEDVTGLQGGMGFEVAALTRATATEPMAELARGSMAVVSVFLNHNDTLPLFKSWMETLDRKVRAMLTCFVEQHVAPLLLQESFLAVLSHSPDGSSEFSVGEGCDVTVNPKQRAIDLSYHMEDAAVKVRILLPSAFPLLPPTVEFTSGRGAGVSTDKWRWWMLKMSVMLFGGSANIWECIQLFHRNLAAHFGGTEPCPICFAVVSSITHKLPDMRCSMCRNSAFHSDCLSRWWSNGGNNVCPLCRSPWIPA